MSRKRKSVEFMQTSPVLQAAKKRRKTYKPFQQGELDGLCGLYASVNAMKHIFKQGKSSDDYEALLCACISACDSKAFQSFFLNGMTDDNMQETLSWIRSMVRRSWHANVNIVKTVAKTKEEWLQIIQAHLKDQTYPRCAIVLFQGKIAHWTVVFESTPKTLKFTDSGRMKELLTSNIDLLGIDDVIDEDRYYVYATIWLIAGNRKSKSTKHTEHAATN